MAEHGLWNRHGPEFLGRGSQTHISIAGLQYPVGLKGNVLPVNVEQRIGLELIAGQIYLKVFRCGLALFNCRRASGGNREPGLLRVMESIECHMSGIADWPAIL